MIKIMNLRNCKPTESYDFLIDRRTPVGNPFNLTDEVNRDRVCIEYEDWFENQLESNKDLCNYLELLVIKYKQQGKLRLFCWCAPKRCHGETIKNYLENLKED